MCVIRMLFVMRNLPYCKVARHKFEMPPRCASSLEKDQKEKLSKVIVVEKIAQQVYLYLSPTNQKIACRLKRENGVAHSREQLMFIRVCGKYMPQLSSIVLDIFYLILDGL